MACSTKSQKQHLEKLFQAIEKGDLKQVKYYVKQPYFNILANLPLTKIIETRSCHCHITTTAIIVSILHNKQDTLKLLIANHCDINLSVESYKTPLYYALEQNNHEILNILLDSHVFLGPFAQNKTAISIAVEFSNLSIISLLLQNMSHEILIQDTWGNSALHKACIRNNDELEILKLLLNKLNFEIPIPLYYSLVVLACKNKKTSIIQYIIEYFDFDINTLLEYKRFYSDTVFSSKTVLMFACKYNIPELVSFCIVRGADVNITSSSGKTALFYACYTNNDEIISLLLDKGANLDILDFNGASALSIACSTQYIKNVSLLLEHNANIEHIDRYGNSPLLIACNIDNYYVKTYQDMPNFLTRAVYTPLTEIVSMLLENGANINHVNNDGESALILACKHGKKEIVSLLLGNGANVIHKDKFRRNAIFYASKKKEKEIVNMLRNNDKRILHFSSKYQE
jgi:ankyrin repeat protein